MTNAVILSNDIYLVKNILNNIHSAISYKLTTKLSEFEDILTYGKIDMIFLDSKINSSFKKMILEKYKNYPILTVRSDIPVSNKILPKINKIEKIQDENDLRTQIISELRYLGYNLSHQGTYYLVDVIIEILKMPDKPTYNLKKDIYPIISKRTNKTMINIKNSIHKASNYMYCTCDIEKLKRYFGFLSDTKPTVKQIVFSVINRL